jgi:hypothetical protein
LLQKGNDGDALTLADFTGSSNTDATNPIGLTALSSVDEISLLCCPDEGVRLVDPTSGAVAPAGTIAGQLVAACADLKDRFAILQSAAEAVVGHEHGDDAQEDERAGHAALSLAKDISMGAYA